MICCFEPIEAKDLARLAGVSRQAVSSVLTKLEAKGLVTRDQSLVDRRLAHITTTPEGSSLVLGNLMPQNEVQHDFFSPLTPDELQTFIRLLSRIIVPTNRDADSSNEDGAELRPESRKTHPSVARITSNTKGSPR